MRLTDKEKRYVKQLLEYDKMHYDSEVDRCNEQLSYEKRKEVIKQIKENLKEYTKVSNEAQKIIDKINKSFQVNK